MEKRKMKKMTNLSTIHAKCVTIMPKDIQLAHNICGKQLIILPKPNDELLGLIVNNDNSMDEAIVITPEDDVIITDDEIKKIRANE